MTIDDYVSTSKTTPDAWYYVITIKQAEIIALQENPEQSRDFLKKISSNFRLSGQKLFLDFKNPFKILAEAEPRLWRGEATIAQNSNFVK